MALTGPEADRALNRAKHFDEQLQKLREKIAAVNAGSDRASQKALNKEIVELSDVSLLLDAVIAYFRQPSRFALGSESIPHFVLATRKPSQ